MIKEKTDYGIIHKCFKDELYHVSFSKEFKNLIKKEDKIVMHLINEGYDILEKQIFYVGGETHRGVDAYILSSENEVIIEPYEYVEHGAWKMKFKIKKRK